MKRIILIFLVFTFIICGSGLFAWEKEIASKAVKGILSLNDKVDFSKIKQIVIAKIPNDTNGKLHSSLVEVITNSPDLKFEIVERSNLKEIFEEIDWQKVAGELDPATKVKLNKIKAVQAILFGNITVKSDQYKKTYDVRLKLIQVQTSQVLWADSYSHAIQLKTPDVINKYIQKYWKIGVGIVIGLFILMMIKKLMSPASGEPTSSGAAGIEYPSLLTKIVPGYDYAYLESRKKTDSAIRKIMANKLAKAVEFIQHSLQSKNIEDTVKIDLNKLLSDVLELKTEFLEAAFASFAFFKDKNVSPQDLTDLINFDSGMIRNSDDYSKEIEKLSALIDNKAANENIVQFIGTLKSQLLKLKTTFMDRNDYLRGIK